MAPLITLSRQTYLNPCYFSISPKFNQPYNIYHSTDYTHTHKAMDGSWRMQIGTSATKHHQSARRSPEDPNRLHPEDFDDVFGGPPRSVLFRQYSGEGGFERSRSLAFEDVFRKGSDRRLPEFRIPVGKTSDEEFYSDIFGNGSGSGDLRRSRSRSVSQTNSNSNSKSKSNSSSILSSEEVSPFRPPVVGDDDVSFSSFAAKLRPIIVSSKWNTSKKMHEVQQMPDSPCKYDSFESDYIHKFKGYYSGFSQLVSSPETTAFRPNSSQLVSSPEITAFRPNSFASVKESVEDLQVNSPASIVSSLNQDQGDETVTVHEKEEEEEEDDDDEVMSSFVIEINPSKNSEISGVSDGLDEAIAWAKQKCEARNIEQGRNKREDDDHECPAVEETPGAHNVPEVQIGRHGSRESPALDKQKVRETEEPLQELEKDASPCKQMELELLDEDINLWSDGKETNIRLLLATLHHILWPSSGWIMIPLTDLKESSNVKKAYQKARLCLHPDKLQQRGATISQKYVAEKAFPILQDAWAAFISQDVCSSIK